MIKSLNFSSIYNEDGYYYMRFHESIKYSKESLKKILLEKDYLNIDKKVVPLVYAERDLQSDVETNIGRVIDIDIENNHASVEIEDKYKDLIEKYEPEVYFGFIIDGDLAEKDDNGKFNYRLSDITGFQLCYPEMKTLEERLKER